MNLLKSHILSVGTLLDETTCNCMFIVTTPEHKKKDCPYYTWNLEKELALSAAREQNEVILKMIGNLKKDDIGQAIQNSEGAFHPSQSEIDIEITWNAALDAIANLIKEANRE